MVNDGFMVGEQAAAERRMILSHVPIASRAGLAALLLLDDTLAAILRSTRDPMVGQLRLTWWHDALAALDTRPPPAEPVLQAIARDVMPHVMASTLTTMVEGWEELLDPDPLDDTRLAQFAERRGAGLFMAAGSVLGAGVGDPVAEAGRGWALVDLARHVRDDATRDRAAELAVRDLSVAASRRWSRAGRPLGAMAHLARLDPAAGGGRVARVVWHRLTGR